MSLLRVIIDEVPAGQPPAVPARGRFLLALIVCFGAVLRIAPTRYGLPFVFHPDETHLITELGKFLGGISRGDVPFGISTFHYPLALVYAAYFGVGRLTGEFSSLIDVQNAFLRDAQTLHLLGRSMSALFSVGTLLATYGVGREVYGPRVGLIAMLLMTVCLLDISSAHWLKADSFVTMMSLLAVLAILRACRARPRAVPRSWVLGVVLGVAIATRVDLMVLVPLLVAASVIAPDGRISRSALGSLLERRLWITLAVAAAIYLLVSFQLAELVARRVGNLPPAFATRPVATSILLFLAAGDMAVSVRHNAWFYLTRGLIGTSGIVLTAFVVAGFARAVRAHRREDVILVSLAGLTLVPLLVFNVYGLHYFGRFMPLVMILAASALVGTSALAPPKAQSWFLAALVAAAVAQPAYYSVQYVRYAATNVDTRTRAREWIYKHIPLGTSIAVQKFDEIPAYLPPLNQSREYATEKLQLLQADGRGSGLALQARLLSYPEDTYAITNLSIEHRWTGARLPLENHYDFERLKASGVRYVVTSSANSPLMEEEAAVQGLLIAPSTLDKDAFARYHDFVRQLDARAPLVAEFNPRDAATVHRTDSPIDKTIRIYRLQ